jgi:predicted metal-dependent hydrolase
MSEVSSNEPVEQVIPEAETEGQIAEAIGEIESLSEQEIELLPVDEFGDKYVAVQVNGEEVRVPLKEALSGYQRQADYTRKTQELGEQRRQVQFGAALQEALQNDPKGTLELLKQHYGLDQTALTPEEEELQDPVERQYRQLEQRVQAFEHQKAADELERTVASLQSKYEDFDANEVVNRLLAQRI